MSHPKIKLIGDPALKNATISLSTIDDEVNALVQEMMIVMDEAEGVGLAANQLGSDKRVFVMNTRGSKEVFVNPEILSQEDPIIFEEACLSIPGVTAKTQRFNKVRIKYYKLENLNMPIEEALEGIPAVAVQHEMDHLNGRLYVDQFGPLKKTMVLDKHKKYLKNLNR